jgi:hypothetical protein
VKAIENIARNPKVFRRLDWLEIARDAVASFVSAASDAEIVRSLAAKKRIGA